MYVPTTHETQKVKKKNNVSNTDKTWQLKQDKAGALEMSSVGIHAGAQCRVREQKKFYGNKTSTGCWTRRNL